MLIVRNLPQWLMPEIRRNMSQFLLLDYWKRIYSITSKKRLWRPFLMIKNMFFGLKSHPCLNIYVESFSNSFVWFFIRLFVESCGCKPNISVSLTRCPEIERIYLPFLYTYQTPDTAKMFSILVLQIYQFVFSYVCFFLLYSMRLHSLNEYLTNFTCDIKVRVTSAFPRS